MKKVLWETHGKFGPASVAELTDKLTELVGNFPPEEVFFEIYQSGDQWDGYSLVEIRVEREETGFEALERRTQEAHKDAALKAQNEAFQRAQFERLKAKFEGA